MACHRSAIGRARGTYGAEARRQSGAAVHADGHRDADDERAAKVEWWRRVRSRCGDEQPGAPAQLELAAALDGRRLGRGKCRVAQMRARARPPEGPALHARQVGVVARDQNAARELVGQIAKLVEQPVNDRRVKRVRLDDDNEGPRPTARCIVSPHKPPPVILDERAHPHATHPEPPAPATGDDGMKDERRHDDIRAARVRHQIRPARLVRGPRLAQRPALQIALEDERFGGKLVKEQGAQAAEHLVHAKVAAGHLVRRETQPRARARAFRAGRVVEGRLRKHRRVQVGEGRQARAGGLLAA